MNTDLEQKIVENFDKIAGIKVELQSSSALDALNWTPDEFAIEISIHGGAAGWVCMTIDKNLATRVAREVLSRALSEDFPIENIDAELAENTVGELVNIALGEYFVARRGTQPADISSPIYHDTSRAPQAARPGTALDFRLGQERFRVAYVIE